MTNYFEVTDPVGRIFAVGDIHGCLAPLETLLDHLVEQKLSQDDYVVFIGDYIDRGPDSKGCVDALLSFQLSIPATCIFLRGNHEDMLLAYLEISGSGGPGYLANGGAECLRSYGLESATPIDQLISGIGDSHMNFYRSLERYAILGDYVFAHAGLSPLRDLRFQLDEDLYWIREDFIENMHYFKKTVVFGHTPFQDVFFNLPYKIGIDTGLVYQNKFSAIEVTEERIFQIQASRSEVEEVTFKDRGGIWPRY